MGNWCFGLKERLTALFIIRAFKARRLRTEDLRVVVLGSSDASRSALLQRWAHGAHFPTNENPCCQWHECKHAQGLLHITDTPGNLGNPGIRRLTIARAHAFILIYSVTRKESLEELKPFLELIRKVKGNNLHKFPIVLVGNKENDERPREVAVKEGAAFAMEWNCAFMETSTRADANVQQLLYLLLNHKKKPAPCMLKKSQVSPATTEKLLGKFAVM
ncbi:GTP-binding protein Di-Ras3 [Castor canadensis]|jgi:GTPase SAR1 family protein